MATDTAAAGVFEGMTHEEYHAMNGYIGHSMLDVFRDNPAAFHGRFISGEISPSAPTPAMRLGTLLHCAVLLPERWTENHIVAPPTTKDGERWNRAKNAHKAEWAEFLAQADGKTIIEADHYESVACMRDAIWRHPEAKELLSHASSTEQAIWWRDDETGLLCKSMRDIVAPGGIIDSRETDVLGDLKTSSDPSPAAFARSCANFGYHRQDAFYCAGHLASTDRPAVMRFIVVQSSAPWTVALYQLRECDTERGGEQNRQALRELAQHKESGDWTPTWAKACRTLALPKWTEYETEYQPLGE